MGTKEKLGAPKRRNPETLWRLVDARCKQLADAVAAARIPFLLALTWAFVWGWALYSAEHGYMEVHVKEMAALHEEVQSRAPELEDHWQQLCRMYLIQVKGEALEKLRTLTANQVRLCLNHFTNEGKGALDWLAAMAEQSVRREPKPRPYSASFINRCMWHWKIQYEKDLYDQPHLITKNELQICDRDFRERLPTQLTWAGGVVRESRLVAFPFNLGKITISDLCILGQAGLLLILAWSFFALRRENHALVSLIDFDKQTQKRAVCAVFAYLFLPKWLGQLRYGIVPQDRYLSAEHLAYANHVTAQRFLFIFSRRAKPLLKTTLALGLLPLGVAAWNFGTDVRDVFRMGSTPTPTVHLRVLLEIVMLLAVSVVTARTMWFAMHTAVVLNGWHLATRVWMEEWDERTDDPASPVIVDALTQQARRATVSEVLAGGNDKAAPRSRILCCAACHCVKWKGGHYILPRLWRRQFTRFWARARLCVARPHM